MKLRKIVLITIAAAALGLALLVAARHNRALRSEAKKLIASGSFHQVAHRGEGIAAIYELSNGERVLSLSGFRTGEGQSLVVILISEPDAFENETIEKAERIIVADLQRSEGDQSYRLPDAIDLTKYKAVTVWSTKHRVNFTTAPLCLQ